MQPDPLDATGELAPVAGAAFYRCVGDARAFNEQYWGAAPLLRRAGTFADLLSFDDVDELISERGLRAPFLRVIRDGRLVDTSRFTGTGGPGAEIPDQVRDERVLAYWLDGATLVLQALHRIWPPLRNFCVELAEAFGCPVQANAYVTPAGATGLPAHYDTHDVFILHCAGGQRWRVHRPVHPDPLDRTARGARADKVASWADGEPVIDHVMTAGDVLYLPRGWVHTATATDRASLHIRIGLRRPTRYTLVEALLAAAANEPDLRRGLPPRVDLSDPAQLGPHLDAVVKALHVWLDAVAADQVAARLGGLVRHRPGPVHPIAQAAAADTLCPSDSVRLRPGLRFELHDRDAGLEIALADRTVTVPRACFAAIRALGAAPEVRVDELPGLGEEDQLGLVRRLLREAVVVRVERSQFGVGLVGRHARP